MAHTNSDGSIVLLTSVDTSGIKEGAKDIKDGLKDAEKAAKGFEESVKDTGKEGGKAFENLGDKIKVVGKALAVALVATKVKNFVTEIVNAFADFEQLQGGVDTIFKGASEKVQQYAQDAWKSVGISANQYMQTVTGFSASLIQSLGGDTDKAADVANMALVDMADNVNKMGSSMESVQYAYQGFAKQNYTMLDNLKLGYGGTRTEMERLLKDAEAVTGIKYDISNISDVYNAIHVIQSEMGITGTTAKEAMTTITGSANAAKAAWQNVIVAIGRGEGIEQAIENFVGALNTYLDNLMPTIERALSGIGTLIANIAPKLVTTIARQLVAQLPALMAAVYDMMIGVAKAIWEGIKAIFTGGDYTAALTESMDDTKAAIEDATVSQENLTAAVEDTSKAQNKLLAGFDDLQVLGSQNAAAGETAMPSLDIGGEDTGGLDTSGLDEAKEKIKKDLDELQQKASIALMAVGLLLIVFGHAVMGVAALAAGVVMFVKQAKKDEDFRKKIEEFFGGIGGLLVGIALAVIGIILLVAQHWILGIGLLAAGIVVLGYTASLNWDAISAKIEEIFGGAAGVIIGIVLVVIGIILCVAHHWVLGVGLIAGGAGALGYSAYLNWDTIVEKIKEVWGNNALILGIAALMVIIGILVYISGKHVIGIAAIAIGVGLMVAKAVENWGSIMDKIKEMWANDELILAIGALMVIIGIFCIIAGNFPVGLGALLVGVGLMVAKAVENWGSIMDKIKEMWANDELILAIGALMVIIGIFCIIAGNFPIGLGAILIGVGLMVAKAVENWDAIMDKIREIWDNDELILGIGALMVIIGILLCIIGNFPLGIGAIAIGAALMIAKVVENWNEITDRVTKMFQDYKEELIGLGIAMVVIGILLCVAGVLPLGFGLIAAGAVVLGATVALNWDFFKEKLKSMWDGIKKFWNEHIKPIFTKEWWLNLAKKVGNGLIEGFEKAINGVISMFENMINWVVDKLNKLSFDVPDWVPGIGGKTFGFNLDHVEFKRVSFPRLARGAVLPGGKPFAAIVNDQPAGQTNIEAPLKTIEQAVENVLNAKFGNGILKEERYYMSETEMMRVIYKCAKQGERLKGTSLIKGGAF